MVQFLKDDNTFKVFDRKLYTNAAPNISCLVVLYNETDDIEVARTTTDEFGDYVFELDLSSVAVGLYQMQFFGSKTIQKFLPDGDWEKFEITFDMLSDLDPLSYTVSPIMTVYEATSKIDVNNNEIAKVDFSFINLLPTKGTLTRIEIYSKLSDEIGAEYELLRSYPVTAEIAVLTLKSEILLKDKPIDYDFKAAFIDSLGIPYKVASVVYYSEVTSVTLDGVPDVLEYIEVIDAEAINTDDPESGELTSDVIKITWADFKTLTPAAYPITSNDAFGNMYDISYEVSRRITTYGVFMFVSDTDTLPQSMYPGITAQYGLIGYGVSPWAFKGVAGGDPNGIWVFMGEFSTANCELKLPLEKYVGFWVGFKTGKTVSKIEYEKMLY